MGILKKYGEHYPITGLKPGQPLMMAGGRGKVVGVVGGVVKIAVSDGNGKDYALNQSQFDKDVQINEAGGPGGTFVPFVTPKGYRVEFYDQPRVLDRNELEKIVDIGEDNDVQAMLAVPFVIRRGDDIYNLVFLTVDEAGMIITANKRSADAADALTSSGELEYVRDEMMSRFNFTTDIPETGENPPPSVDDLLDKISATGMGSLTAAQRGILDRASNEKKSNTHMEKFVPLFEEFAELYCDENGDMVCDVDVNEKWDTDTEIKQTGQYSGKTIEELKSMRAKLKAKKERTAAESTKLRQINFAIRAKRDFKGKV